jgi:methionyl-tRNA formyltransferase
MRIIVLGTGPFAVPTLQALAASHHEVLLVITRPPQGRRPEASPLQRAAELLGLQVWSPPTVNDADAHSRLTTLAADLLVVCDYGEILHPATLATAQLGGINLHGSLLPKYRGAAPVQWAILRGETETGNSLIQMTPGLDAGPCLGQQRTLIDPDEDAGQLENRLAATGADLVLQVIDQLESGTATPIEQDKTLASKAPRLKKEDGAIDWSRPAQEIKNQVRALRPWPRAFTYWHRENAEPLRLNIDRVSIHPLPPGEGRVRVPPGEGRVRFPPGEGRVRVPPGTILEAPGHLLIATGDNPLEILELQPAGKRAMSAAEFLRGHRLHAANSFGPA